MTVQLCSVGVLGRRYHHLWCLDLLDPPVAKTRTVTTVRCLVQSKEQFADSRPFVDTGGATRSIRTRWTTTPCPMTRLQIQALVRISGSICRFFIGIAQLRCHLFPSALLLSTLQLANPCTATCRYFLKGGHTRICRGMYLYS